jgi:hypothetical protein
METDDDREVERRFVEAEFPSGLRIASPFRRQCRRQSCDRDGPDGTREGIPIAVLHDADLRTWDTRWTNNGPLGNSKFPDSHEVRIEEV